MYSANVSHEMRTPLSTSINFTDLLLSTEKDQTKRKHLKIIKFSSILMLNNVNDTLDNAQIQRGTFTTNPVRCDILQTVTEVVRVIEMQAASKNIYININVPQKTIIADKQRIQQVCMNLLSNACKFTQDGEILVTAWVLSPEKDPDDQRENVNKGMLYVSVKDTGRILHP
jgi:signal transduction histidine kinase